jgi:hypothetical protein
LAILPLDKETDIPQSPLVKFLFRSWCRGVEEQLHQLSSLWDLIVMRTMRLRISFLGLRPVFIPLVKKLCILVSKMSLSILSLCFLSEFSQLSSQLCVRLSLLLAEFGSGRVAHSSITPCSDLFCKSSTTSTQTPDLGVLVNLALLLIGQTQGGSVVS